MTAPWDHRSDAERARVEGLVLDRWLPAAVAFSSHWSAVANELGVRAHDLDSRADLGRFPPSRERDLSAAGGPGAPGLLMRPTEAQIRAHASGGLLWQVASTIRREGTLGKEQTLLEEYKPVQVVHAGRQDDLVIGMTRTDLDRLHRVGARAAAVLGLDDRDYLVSAVPAGPRLDFWGVYHLALGRSMLALHPRGAGQDLDAVVHDLRLVPTTAVAAPLAEAERLASLVASAGADASRVATVITVGAPPDAATRTRIREAWQHAGAPATVRVRALYAPTGGRSLWAECAEDEGAGLHTYPDLEILEIVDPVTGAVTNADGDLTTTSAGWHGTALLRFQTGDHVETITTDPCPGCGRLLPRVIGEVTPGAWQPEVDGADGTAAVVDFRGVAAVLATIGGVEAWRAELGTGPSGDRLRVELAAPAGSDDLDEVRDRLRSATGDLHLELDTNTDAARIEASVEELGSVFADVR